MSVTKIFSEVKDPRSKKGKRYQLASVLTLVELATAANCNNISAVYRFAKSLSKEFLALIQNGWVGRDLRHGNLSCL